MLSWLVLGLGVLLLWTTFGWLGSWLLTVYTADKAVDTDTAVGFWVMFYLGVGLTAIGAVVQVL